MELSPYLRILRKWLLLIVLVALVAGSVSFINNVNRPPSYQAQTTISVGTSILDQPNPSSADISLAMGLAPTYQQLLTSYDILQGTVEALNLPMTADQLRRLITSRIVTSTALLVITVTYTDPVLTADIANALAEQLIAQSPTNLTTDQEQQIAFANEQITELNTLLTQSQEQLARLDERIAASTDSVEITTLTQQRNETVAQVNLALATIADFSRTISDIQQRTNAIDVVERARVPVGPTDSNSLGSTVGAAVLGAIAAFGVALVIEYLDDTIRTSEEATAILSLPVLGAILRYGDKKMKDIDRLVSNQATLSGVAEAYRSLRTNVLYALGDIQEKTPVLVVTSPGPEEGKTLTATNLAIAMAQADLRVLLIDADLRRPKLHTMFGLENNVGLTTLLRGEFTQGDGSAEEYSEQSKRLRECFQTAGIPKLRIITSGIIPPNPAELLGSPLIQKWVEMFRAVQDIDVVIFDTPPCLTLSDSPILANNVDASVLLVLDMGRTHRRAAHRAKELFGQVGKELFGIVANRTNPREEAYSYGYYRYYYAYGYTYGERPPSRLSRLLQPFRSRRSPQEKQDSA
ncbi:MAG: polysaccharide biosynthesis tyrosine autokinase [Anaerolinea sp.]|nr:polysaccharide biosynthesis tyrosine autokinase [Anaerolinea sp.]